MLRDCNSMGFTKSEALCMRVCMVTCGVIIVQQFCPVPPLLRNELICHDGLPCPHRILSDTILRKCFFIMSQA